MRKYLHLPHFFIFLFPISGVHVILKKNAADVFPQHRKNERRMGMPAKEVLERVYGESEKSGERFQYLAARFAENFGDAKTEFFTSPGRTEMIGNHTDHNGGKIVAASISLDTIGAAAPNNTGNVRIRSEGYDLIDVEIASASSIEKKSGTRALIAGMIEAIGRFGYAIKGFDAYVTTEVIAAAGVSSSASFEMLFCAMVNSLFNDNKIPLGDCARIGQYAENNFWMKSSGLMDQMACAAGGAILLDFANDIKCEKINVSFDALGYDMVIVNTGKGHGDLSEEYSAVPAEMFQVAGALGVKRLCESSLEEFLKKMPEITTVINNDRAIMRALHFFEENRRVEEAAEALAKGDGKAVLSLLAQSGNSSWKWLQNCMSKSNEKDQKVALTLALTELYLDKIKDGCCRIHGGGFAGVILAVVPKDKTDGYVDYISGFVGRENVYPMQIRQTGAVSLGY